MGNGIIKYLKTVIGYFLDIVYYKEEKCILCNENLLESFYLCKDCKEKVKTCSEVLNFYAYNKKVEVYSALYYSAFVKEIVHKLKYKNDFRCGDVLVYYMVEIIKNNNIDFDLVTYVPIGKQNAKKRGYNQSKYLAKCIGKLCDKKVVDILEKSKETEDQIGLNHKERWENLKQSFKFKNNKFIKHKKILLIDDVITTGATAYYCSCELIKNYSGKIIVLTAAKSSI